MKNVSFHVLNGKVLNSLSLAGVNASQLRPEDFPYDLQVAASNLRIPWAIAISDDGRIFLTERPGTIRVIEDGRLINQPVITLQAPFISSGEGGLMGIVLDPDFQSNHYLYIMHTYTEGMRIFNRVVRLREQNNQAALDRVIFDRIPGGQIHNGGRLKIGPDRKLYATTGDSGNAGLAQNLSSLAGKILRMELDGSIPSDNPIAGSYVYSYGHRNPQGLAWNSRQMLYETEHGQRAQDEINLIEAGANYGWPLIQGSEASGQLRRPIVHSGQETWAPSGITFVTQGPWRGRLLVASLRGEQLLAVTFDEAGVGVLELESWLWNEFGRLREAVEAKDGSIYLTTNNLDGRGRPSVGDDKILRLIPRSN